MTDIDDIVDLFELLGDWDQRYQYLIELGEKLSPLPEQYRITDNQVKGCMSQVWVKAVWKDTQQIEYHGDCDTPIIKGVLALLIELLSNKTPQQIAATDVDQLFERLQLADHLSPNRHFGIYALVELMKKQAQDLTSNPLART